MKKEAFLGILRLSLITAYIEGTHKEVEIEDIEASLSLINVVARGSHENEHSGCILSVELRSALDGRKGTMEAAATFWPTSQVDTGSAHHTSVYLSLRIFKSQCRIENLPNKTTTSLTFDTTRISHILRHSEPIGAGIAGCTTRVQDLGCFIKSFLAPFNEANGTTYDVKNKTRCKEPYDWCSILLKIRVRSTSVLNITESIPSELKDLVGTVETSRSLFCGYSTRKLVKRDLLMKDALQLSDSDETTLGTLFRSGQTMQHDVKILTLLNSRLKYIPKIIFEMRALQRLSIKRTVLSANETFTVSPVPLATSRIQHLSLEGTAVHFLHDQAFCNFPNLLNLYLELCSLRAVYGSPFRCLSNLQELHMPSNALRTITRETFKGLKNLKVLGLSKNKLAFYDTIPVFAPLTTLKALHLGENKIDALFPEVFIVLTVTTRELEANLISNWSIPIFSRMPNLENLNLDSNKIRVLDDMMYADMANVTRVGICHNPWDCTDCHIKNAERLLARAKLKTCVFCAGNKGPLANLPIMIVAPDVEECKPPDYYALVGVPTLLVFLAGTFGGYSVYTKRWYIHYFLLFLRVKVKGYRRVKNSDRYLWDAFVSYHHSDADWVREHVILTLESTALRFRLCVGERDFIPGLPIVENVCRGIAQSRKSLFVLSRQFCASRWCMFELSLAKHRLFESDRENQMVFILREHIEECEMCPLLRYLSGTKTYVQVPPVGANESVQGYFWLQMRAALEF